MLYFSKTDLTMVPRDRIKSIIIDLKKSLIIIIAIHLLPTGFHINGVHPSHYATPISYVVYINKYDRKARFQEQLEEHNINYQLSWRLLEHAGHNRLACKLTIDGSQLNEVNVVLKWLTDTYKPSYYTDMFGGNFVSQFVPRCHLSHTSTYVD
jgi:hypothetical protein